MSELADMTRAQLEAGVRYPSTAAGSINAYGGSSRELAREIDRAEGRTRAPESTQRSIQRYLRGERHPSPERLGRMRQLARRRIAERRLAPLRSRGARVFFAGRVIVYTDPRRGPQYRTVRFQRDVSGAQLDGALDRAERSMLTGRGWDGAGDALLHAAFDAYGSPLEEVATIDALSVTPL
jgi:hypothetical protein